MKHGKCWLLLVVMWCTGASAAGVALGDASKGKATAETVCAACHGADGNSVIGVNPTLAGQIPEYLYQQLRSFKSQNGKPALRNNAIMGGMVAALSDDDMKNLAAWFASQPIKADTAKNPATIELAKKIWRGGDTRRELPACAGCHGPSGAGLPVQYPRLSGQHPEYTEAQLKAFRSGERSNDDNETMRMIAAKLSDHEIKALADYIAGLR